MSRRIVVVIGVAILFQLLAGCASTPDDGTQTPPLNVRVDAILAIPVEGAAEDT